MAFFDLLLNVSFILLDGGLQSMGPLLKLVLLEFEQGLFLLLNEELLLDFVDALLERPVVLLDLLNLRGDHDLLVVHAVLVSFVEVALFSQFVPCRFGLLSLNLGLFELLAHFLDLESQARILVCNVRYQANAIVLENSLLLEFVPLLLECVHGLFHFKPLQEVPNEIVDDHISLEHLRSGLHHWNLTSRLP